jgi:hypothetical protein
MARRPKLDPAAVDKLLDGSLRPDDAPPELAKVASMIAAAAEVPAAATVDPAFVASLAAAVRDNPTPDAVAVATRRKPVLAKVLTVKAGVLAGVLIFGATGAAAATGNLPDAAQHGVATAAEHIGLNLPDTANDHARNAHDNGKSGEDHGKSGEDHGKSGEDHGKSGDNHGAEVSDVAHNTETTGVDHGAAVCAVASDNKCTEHRGSGEDHGAPVATHDENDDEGEHSTTTAVSTPERHDDGQDDATNGAGDHPGPGGSNSGESGHGGSGRD